jgi:SAM-dependent methyltransferase
MTREDLLYLQKVLSLGFVKSPSLEIGVGWESCTEDGASRGMLTAAGIEHVGCDIKSGPAVDLVADCSADSATFKAAVGTRSFGSVICMNVLEHVFDPVQTLRNLVSVVRPGGTCVLVTPTLWPLHECPLDCWRINPNFYEEFSRREKLTLSSFDWVTHQLPVASTTVWDAGIKRHAFTFPPRASSRGKDLYSRIVHRLLRTTGRGATSPTYASIGVVLAKPQPSVAASVSSSELLAE